MNTNYDESAVSRPISMCAVIWLLCQCVCFSTSQPARLHCGLLHSSSIADGLQGLQGLQRLHRREVRSKGHDAKFRWHFTAVLTPLASRVTLALGCSHRTGPYKPAWWHQRARPFAKYRLRTTKVRQPFKSLGTPPSLPVTANAECSFASPATAAVVQHTYIWLASFWPQQPLCCCVLPQHRHPGGTWRQMSRDANCCRLPSPQTVPGSMLTAPSAATKGSQAHVVVSWCAPAARAVTGCVVTASQRHAVSSTQQLVSNMAWQPDDCTLVLIPYSVVLVLCYQSISAGVTFDYCCQCTAHTGPVRSCVL
jgi:hypothetical protein